MCLVLNLSDQKSEAQDFISISLSKLFLANMKHAQVFLAVLYLAVVFSTSVLSLKCNTCSSAKSWDDCKSKEVTCPASIADRCVKAHLKYGDIENFAKYCGTEAYCDKDKNPTCKLAKAGGASECSIYCCEGDLCNAGSAVKISGIVMLACTLALLLFQNA